MPAKRTRQGRQPGTAHPKSGECTGDSGTVSSPDDSKTPADAAPVSSPEPSTTVPEPTRTPAPGLMPPETDKPKARGRVRQLEIEAERKAETMKDAQNERERIEREARDLAPEAEDTLDCVFGVIASILGEHWELTPKERAKLAIRFGRVYAKRGAGSKFLTEWSAELALAGSLGVVCLSRVFKKGMETDADSHNSGEPGIGEKPTGTFTLSECDTTPDD